MKVLFAVWELDPFFKLGGLGDVARSLPGALKTLGIDIRTIVPYYTVVKMGRNKKEKIGEFRLRYAGRNEKIEVWEVPHPYTKVPAYFLKNKRYLEKAAPIDTWGFFDKAVVEVLKNNILNWQPDIIHINDRHCGLIPLLLKVEKLPIKTLLTIHNLAYQGKSSTSILKDMDVNPSFSEIIKWEIKSNQVNFLMEGIIHSDIITVVSPTYAKEILSERYGQGLNELLRKYENKIFGILNGIDVDLHYLTHNSAVKYPYNAKEKVVDGKFLYYGWQEGKKLNKRYLQKKLGLTVDENIPLLCFIGRLDPIQKGLDIMHAMLRRVVENPKFEFVILGDGNTDWEERFKWLSTFYPKLVSCNFRFDEALAHQMYAGSDFIVIPSLYEPCGLIQMIAMLFGTLPIAHKTGGLKDSIKDGYNGFLYSEHSSEVLEKTIDKAISLLGDDRKKYEEMVENALKTDFSWKKSAKEYILLYEKLLNNL